MQPRTADDLTKIINRLVMIQKDEILEDELKKINIDILHSMHLKLLSLIKAERKKLKTNVSEKSNKSVDAVTLTRLVKFLSTLKLIISDKITNSKHYDYMDPPAMEAFDRALHTSVFLDQPENTREILRDHPKAISSIDGEGLTALHRAALLGRFDCTKILLHREADVNALTPEGNTPLHLATNPQIADYLLKKGAVLNAMNYQLETPLQLAVEKGNPDMVSFFISRSADVNLKDTNGRNAFFIAASKGDKTHMDLLAKNGAKVNARDRFLKATALHAVAATTKDPDVVPLLISLGGNLHAENKLGETPADLAAGNHVEVLKVLREEAVRQQKPSASITAPVGVMFPPVTAVTAAVVMPVVTSEKYSPEKYKQR